jgi:hypothetical protein
MEKKDRRLVIRCSGNTLAEFLKIYGEFRRVSSGRFTYEDVLKVFIEVFKQNPRLFLPSKAGPRIR